MFYKWIKNGLDLINDQGRKIENTRFDSHLLLENVNQGDSGNISCIASNAYGSDIQSTILYVKGLKSNIFSLNLIFIVF